MQFKSSAIVAENLCVSAGERLLLSIPSLNITKGGITAIIGPSGSGKSTLLSIFNRLADTTDGLKVSGKVEVSGIDIFAKSTDLLWLRRHVSMVFQKPLPFPLSIRKNLELPFKECCPSSKAQTQREVENSLMHVGLWHEVSERLDSPAQLLSGGQQQRLCLARSLIVKPQVLLLDEPCSALDPVSSAQIEELVLGLRGKLTVVMVTHNLAQARRLADDVIVLGSETAKMPGKMIESGLASEVLSRPKHPFTQRYISFETPH